MLLGDFGGKEKLILMLSGFGNKSTAFVVKGMVFCKHSSPAVFPTLETATPSYDLALHPQSAQNTNKQQT
ncbi:hypothetical protein HHE014_16150 [Helicobacter heilmannii]|nr:hypothetical protein HHE014_16150 [Helicobacter heilmannii]